MNRSSTCFSVFFFVFRNVLKLFKRIYHNNSLNSSKLPTNAKLSEFRFKDVKRNLVECLENLVEFLEKLRCSSGVLVFVSISW